MLLAIEQGNTNSLFAVHDGDRWIAQWRSATEPSRTADEYAVWLSQLMAMHKLELSLLNACVISSVVPQSIFNLRNLSRRYLHVEPLIIGENVELGIQVRTSKPSEVGSDRLVNALGALKLFRAIVVKAAERQRFVDASTGRWRHGCFISQSDRAGQRRPVGRPHEVRSSF
jgi:type III pantothenate kinase